MTPETIQTPRRPGTPASRAVFPPGPLHGRAAFTLVEVIIALVITFITSFAFMGAIIYSAREADRNRDHVYAIQVAEMMTGRCRGGAFAFMGVAGTTSSYERQFAPVMQIDVDTSAAKNAANPTDRTLVNRRYTVTMAQTGWGPVQNATANTLVCGAAAGNRAWNTNEWAGHYVTIASGRGSGQIMRITGNSANSLTVTRALDGSATTPWAINPDATSVYYIDDGKTFELAVTWGTGRNQAAAIETRTINRTVVIPRTS